VGAYQHHNSNRAKQGSQATQHSRHKHPSNRPGGSRLLNRQQQQLRARWPATSQQATQSSLLGTYPLMLQRVGKMANPHEGTEGPQTPRSSLISTYPTLTALSLPLGRIISALPHRPPTGHNRVALQSNKNASSHPCQYSNCCPLTTTSNSRQPASYSERFDARSASQQPAMASQPVRPDGPCQRAL
jgi:hypothetical protein